MSREGAEAYEHKLSQIVDISRHTNTKQTDTRAARVVTSAARAILVAKTRSSEKKRKRCIYGLVCSRARVGGQLWTTPTRKTPTKTPRVLLHLPRFLLLLFFPTKSTQEDVVVRCLLAPKRNELEEGCVPVPLLHRTTISANHLGRRP